MDTPARLDRARPGHVGGGRGLDDARGRRVRARLRARRVAGQRDVVPGPAGRFHVVRRGSGPTVVAVGPMLSATLAATEGLDATVLYANVVRPFDRGPCGRWSGRSEVVLVEPYLAGTSSRLVSDTFADVPHRLLALGVRAEGAALRPAGGPHRRSRPRRGRPAVVDREVRGDGPDIEQAGGPAPRREQRPRSSRPKVGQGAPVCVVASPAAGVLR